MSLYHSFILHVVIVQCYELNLQSHGLFYWIILLSPLSNQIILCGFDGLNSLSYLCSSQCFNDLFPFCPENIMNRYLSCWHHFEYELENGCNCVVLFITPDTVINTWHTLSNVIIKHKKYETKVLKLATFRGQKTKLEKIFILSIVPEAINNPSLFDVRVNTISH